MHDPHDPMDSAGRPINVGDRVQWRDQEYTIKAFGAALGRFGTRTIEFEEPLHFEGEIPDEIAVDFIGGEPCAALQNGMSHCSVRDKRVAACKVCAARGL